MTNEDTTTLNLTPPIVGQKFHRKQSMIFLQQNWITKVMSKKIKNLTDFQFFLKISKVL